MNTPAFIRETTAQPGRASTTAHTRAEVREALHSDECGILTMPDGSRVCPSGAWVINPECDGAREYIRGRTRISVPFRASDAL